MLLLALYLASDLAADTLLARLLIAPAQSIVVLRAITRTKIWTLRLAAIQTDLLFVAAMIRPR